MERLPLSASYDSVEMAIHCGRYALARPFCKGRRVLDLACGEGYGAALMQRWGAAAVTGVDIDEDTVATCRRLFPSCRFVRSAAEEAGAALAPEQFDLIVSLETMEHVQDLESYFESLRRLRAPGGGVIISCPNDPWYNRRRKTANAFHLRVLDHEEFRSTIARAFPGSEIAFQVGTLSAGFLNMRPTLGGDGSFHAALDDLVELQGLAVPSSDREMPPTPGNASYFVAHVDLAPAEATFAGYQLPMEALRALRRWNQPKQDPDESQGGVAAQEEAGGKDRERLEQSQSALEKAHRRIAAQEEARERDRERLEQSRSALGKARQRIAVLEQARDRNREQVQQLRAALEHGRQRIEALEEALGRQRSRS